MIGEISTPKVSRKGADGAPSLTIFTSLYPQRTHRQHSVRLGARFDNLRAPQHPARAAAETTTEGRGGLLLVRKKSDSYSVGVILMGN